MRDIAQQHIAKFTGFLRLFNVFISIICVPSIGLASAPFANVGTAVVNEGESSVEWRTIFTKDDENPTNDDRISFFGFADHAFTDYYALRIVTIGDRQSGENIDAASLVIEHRFQLLDAKDTGFHLGVRFVHSHNEGDNRPDTLTLRGLVQIPLEHWELRGDVIMRRDYGAERRAGLGFEWRARAMRQITPFTSLGVEALHDLGHTTAFSGLDNQAMQIGPTLIGEFGQQRRSYYQLGYRVGVTQAADDHGFRLFLGHRF